MGTKIYFDTAFIKDHIAPEQAKRIIECHGAERILFGSDSPWERPADTLAFLQHLGLTQRQLDQITHENALRLLQGNIA